MHNIAQRWDGLSICDIPCGTLVVNVASLACGRVCEFSDDHWHHADESDYLKVSEADDGTYAVRAKCKYCHQSFVVTDLTADDLSDAYSDYVNTLPAQGYDGLGKLIWQPDFTKDVTKLSLYNPINKLSKITAGYESDFARVIIRSGSIDYVYSYHRSKISRISWLFEPKYRNNAELTYILLPCIAIY